MSGVHYTTELMSGGKSRKWVHQKPTNQPTVEFAPSLVSYFRRIVYSNQDGDYHTRFCF